MFQRRIDKGLRRSRIRNVRCRICGVLFADICDHTLERCLVQINQHDLGALRHEELAAAAPIPPDPPVIIATLPSSFVMMNLSIKRGFA